MPFRIPFPRRIRAQLAALVLAVALPFATLVAFDYSRERDSRTEIAAVSARALASAVAASLAQLIEGERAMLAALAARPSQRLERPEVCDALIAEARTLSPYRANITVSNTSGDPVCSAVPLPAGVSLSVIRQDYAQRLLRTGEFSIGEPFKGPITGRWIAPLAFPRRDAADRLIGWVGVPLDVERIGELLARVSTEPGDVITVISSAGKVISRSADAAKWVGIDVRDRPFAQPLIESRLAAWRSSGLDGSMRVWGAADVPAAGWKVIAGLDEARLLAPANAALLRNTLVITLILLMVAGLSFAISRGIGEPILALAKVARGVAAGERGLRASATGATEISDVGAEFNRMLAALAASERQFRALAEASPVGIYRTDAKGDVTYVNARWCGIAGMSAAEALGQGWARTLRADRERVYAELREGARSRAGFESEFCFERPDGSFVWVLANALPERNDVGEVVGHVGTVTDISGRKRAEEALRDSEAKLRRLIDGLGTSMFVGLLTPEGVVLEANQPALAAAGLKGEDVRGKPVEQTYWFSYSATVQQELRAAVERAAEGEPSRYDVQIRVAEGQFIWLDFSVQPLRDDAGRVTHLLPSAIVITERKQAEAAVKASFARQSELLRRLQETEESERRRINRELHDRIGQNLSMLILNLDLIRSEAPQEALRALGRRIEDAQKVLGGTIAQVRDLMAELHPPALDDFGLLAALRSFCAPLGARAGIPVEVAGSEPSPRLPRQVELALFRVAEGALSNAVKHARAGRIDVTLVAGAALVTLTIADDGAGFDPGAVSGTPSWGLTIMRERAEAVGVTLRVDSAAGSGTRVVATAAREAA